MAHSSNPTTLLRVRPPRVRITYDVETGGSIDKKELPFVIGVLADLSGDVDENAKIPLPDRKFVDIDRDSFNDVMKTLAPSVQVDAIRATSPVLQQMLTPADDVIRFSSIDDFDPVQIVKALPSLNMLYQLRTRLRKFQSDAEVGNTDCTHIDNLLITSEFGDAFRAIAPDIAVTDMQLSAIRAAVTASTDSIATLDALVTHIDRQLSAALSVILHGSAFQQLEATWRGLQYLVANTETGSLLKLRVLNATKEELQTNLAKAAEFDQSALFKMAYEAEYGTFGGLPYSLLIGAYEITHEQNDIDFLTRMSQIAAAAHAPFITAASPELFSLPGFDKLDRPRVLSKMFDGMDLVGWQQFRATEDARYVTLVLPRVLMRLPYGNARTSNTTQCEEFDFEEILIPQQADIVPSEQVEGANPQPAHENFLWGNTAFVLAARITNAFSLYGWTAAIRGLDGGGQVDGLPIYSYAPQSDTSNLVGPTEIPIRASREQELDDLGFIPLCHSDKTGNTGFFNGQTTNLPKRYLSDEADSNARLSSTLPYILTASRFAQYIKVIMRDKIGSFLTRANVEAYLNTWIAQYVLLDDNASQDVKAAYPLRAASIAVTDVPGEPGVYNATLFIQPHFQLEELTTSLRLVVNLPA